MQKNFINSVAEDYFHLSVGMTGDYPVKDDPERSTEVADRLAELEKAKRLDSETVEAIDELLFMTRKFSFVRGFKCAVALQDKQES